MKLKKWLIRQTENLEQVKKMQKKLINLGLISLIGFICTGLILPKFPTYFWAITLITCTIGFTISALLSGVFFLSLSIIIIKTLIYNIKIIPIYRNEGKYFLHFQNKQMFTNDKNNAIIISKI